VTKLHLHAGVPPVASKINGKTFLWVDDHISPYFMQIDIGTEQTRRILRVKLSSSRVCKDYAKMGGGIFSG